MTREVFFTESNTVCLSHGLNVRRSITSTEIPSSSTAFAATRARCTVAPYVTSVTSVPSRTIFAFPNGIMKFAPGFELFAELHVRGPDIIEELNLDHGLESAHGKSNRASNDICFREW